MLKLSPETTWPEKPHPSSFSSGTPAWLIGWRAPNFLGARRQVCFFPALVTIMYPTLQIFHSKGWCVCLALSLLHLQSFCCGSTLVVTTVSRKVHPSDSVSGKRKAKETNEMKSQFASLLLSHDSSKPGRMMLLLFLLVVPMLVKSQDDLFNYDSTRNWEEGTDYGPREWDQVECDDVETCHGWPEKWPLADRLEIATQ